MNYKPGSFYQVPKNIAQAVKSPYTFTVLCSLLQHMNGDGACFPSQETLSQGIMSTKQVKRATGELVTSGIITIKKTWVRGGGIRISYSVNTDVLLQQTHSPVDSQSSGLTVQSLTDSQSNHQRTDSPNNNNQLTKTNKQNISKEKSINETFDLYRSVKP